MDAPDLLKRQLVRSGKTIAVAESLTAGCLQSLIASVSGSSQYFLGGVTTYTLEMKCRLLGVDRDEAQQTNCVSERIAEQMAAGVRRLFDAAIAIATTGYAEPQQAVSVSGAATSIAADSVDREHRVAAEAEIVEPFAYVAIDLEGSVQSTRVSAGTRSRTAAQHHVAATALTLLLDRLGVNR